MRENCWVVITTINEPNLRTLEYVQLGYKVVIVGDTRTPRTWSKLHSDVHFLTFEEQEAKWPVLSRMIGSKTYARKNFGYLYALSHGATIIWETDDDTFPITNIGDPVQTLESHSRYLVSGSTVWNPYSFFVPETHIWPRGFPLSGITQPSPTPRLTDNFGSVDVFQTLVNREPDVDAIYRLTVNSEPTHFLGRDGVVKLTNSIAPGNTQSTFWLSSRSMPYVYFPSTVSNRFADILKMYVCQTQFELVYGGFLVEQFRNPHNYMLDFREEIEMYVNLDELIEVVIQSQGRSITEVYSRIAELGICLEKELDILSEFENSLNEITNS